MKITFIGGGNMATAMISGLASNETPPEWIHVSEPNPEARQRLESAYPVNCYAEAGAAIADANVVVLATKPQVMPLVLEELSTLVAKEQLVISIAAGITIEQISRALQEEPPVVRAMPNTPALIGKGISGVFASQHCSPEQRNMAQRVLKATGEVVWVARESLMDVVTAVSGSGPAYFFLLIEAMRAAGEKLGLDAADATLLALHTANGAGAMAAGSDHDVAELRRRVTSPGGTTQAALDAFEAGGFSELVDDAVKAAARRGVELASTGESS